MTLALATISMACSDGNVATDNDACQADGTCVGVDLCANVTCSAPNQCHLSMSCSHGLCPPNPAAVGSTCNDGNAPTRGDVCNAQAVCAGEDYCVTRNIVCGPPGPCRQPGTCLYGVCSFPLQSDNSECDDGNAVTDFDKCTGGVCAGVDICLLVTWPGIVAVPCDACVLARRVRTKPDEAQRHSVR